MRRAWHVRFRSVSPPRPPPLPSLPQAPPPLPPPALRARGTALGWMFVAESASLEARSLARHPAHQRPLEIETAAAFLSCYGDAVTARWTEFEDAVDAYAADRPIAEELVDAA